MASSDELLISRSRTLRSWRASVVGSSGSGGGSVGVGVVVGGACVSEVEVIGVRFAGLIETSRLLGLGIVLADIRLCV